MRAITLLVASVGWLSAQSAYVGSFQSAEMQVELHARTDGRYTGTIELQGQKLPLTARESGTELTGAFTAGGKSFPFTATLVGPKLQLVSEGHAYVLTRAGGAIRAANGVSLSLPGGWTTGQTDDAIRLLPPGASADEGYFATSKEGYDVADEPAFVKQMSQGFTQSGGVIRKGGERESFPNGTAYHWEILDPKTNQLGAFSLYIVPAGTRAHVVLAVGPAEKVRVHKATLAQVAQSIRYQHQPLSTSATNSPWDQKLRGKVIRQFNASQGMSSEKKHTLGTDGRYSYWSSSMVSVDVPGASGSSFGKDAQKGRWKIIDNGTRAFLEVVYDSGQTRTFALTKDATNWYMNGEKAFAVDPQ